MITELEKFQSGYHGLSIGLSASEIETLIHRLNALKEQRIGHFHYRSKWGASGDKTKLADIEFFMSDATDSASHDMELE